MNNKLFLEFDNYVKKFDLQNEKINDKYKHSYRVYEYAKDIANSLKLSKEDIALAMTCGLLNDIGRFSQINDFDTIIDNVSVDHGDRGYNVLKENNYISKYTENEEEKEIILYVTKNHNKMIPEETFDERKKLFCNIIRDSAKLDILMTKGLEIDDNNYKINRKCIEDIKSKKLCNNNSVQSEIDNIIRMLSFIYDINYNRSFEIILENHIVENKIDLIKKYVDNEELDIIKEELISYMKERLEC